MTRGRTARRGAAWMLLALAGAALGGPGCGRYGAPVRASEYQEKAKEERRAEEQRRQQSTPESRNEPLPAPP